jgi:putative SOS response-associated peptidase YedK
MCYYSSISVGFKIIEDRFGVKFIQTKSFSPVYCASAFTFPTFPVISNENPGHIVFMEWGLIPFWVKDQASALGKFGKHTEHLAYYSLNLLQRYSSFTNGRSFR